MGSQRLRAGRENRRAAAVLLCKKRVPILGQAQTISTRIDESSLSNSANARVPGHVVQPGLVSVIERESARKGSKQFDDGLRCPRGLERDSADPLQTRVHRNEVRVNAQRLAAQQARRPQPLQHEPEDRRVRLHAQPLPRDRVECSGGFSATRSPETRSENESVTCSPLTVWKRVSEPGYKTHTERAAPIASR